MYVIGVAMVGDMTHSVRSTALGRRDYNRARAREVPCGRDGCGRVGAHIMVRREGWRSLGRGLLQRFLKRHILYIGRGHESGEVIPFPMGHTRFKLWRQGPGATQTGAPPLATWIEVGRTLRLSEFRNFVLAIPLTPR